MTDATFPDWFFDRDDPTSDGDFYRAPRLVTHIDDGAVRAVGELYRELGIDGTAPGAPSVLDLMSSWVSHFVTPPPRLTVLGMNRAELDANEAATERVVQDLNGDPSLPFADGTFDAVTCCVSIDYLIRPVEVLAEVARVVKPHGPVVITYSNRCFPTKAIQGWLATTDAQHGEVVSRYLALAGGFGPAEVSLRTPETGYRGDPLWAVVARAR
ncbi:class I SAM-dependent methyltransferase [Marisediminicola senii]|uniref:class I SAM-dependent methyltransferase n=1 Tax=Marisediminicola senii TaxID=2711233 RepID=UPI0013ED3444|nr:class I SAM-dependent methyltransferase [Marisediminicola senii]